LEPLRAKLTSEGVQAGFDELYSKSWSASFLSRLLSKKRDAPWLCSEREVGVTATSVDEAMAAIASIRRGGHHPVVVKQALGLAGHNAIRLLESEVSPAQLRWMARTIEHRQALVVEPWLARVVDFSAQLEMGVRGLSLCGYAGLSNTRQGQYQGNWADPDFARRFPTLVTQSLNLSGRSLGVLQEFLHELYDSLQSELRRAEYRGPIGIDAFVYNSPDGTHRLKPVVEINPRYTMGRLTLELMKRTCPGSRGHFRLLTQAHLRKNGFEDFKSYAATLVRDAFPQLEGQPIPRIRCGTIFLNDPGEAQVCLAVFEVVPGRDETRVGSFAGWKACDPAD
jgi:hypothetical protein